MRITTIDERTITVTIGDTFFIIREGEDGLIIEPEKLKYLRLEGFHHDSRWHDEDAGAFDYLFVRSAKE